MPKYLQLNSTAIENLIHPIRLKQILKLRMYFEFFFILKIKDLVLNATGDARKLAKGMHKRKEPILFEG